MQGKDGCEQGYDFARGEQVPDVVKFLSHTKKVLVNF